MHLQLIQFSTWFKDVYTIKVMLHARRKTHSNEVCKTHIFPAFSQKLVFFPLILKGCSVDFFPFRISFHVIRIMNIYSVRSWTHWVQCKVSIQNLLHLYGVSYRITRKMAVPGTFSNTLANFHKVKLFLRWLSDITISVAISSSPSPDHKFTPPLHRHLSTFTHLLIYWKKEKKVLNQRAFI